MSDDAPLWDLLKAIAVADEAAVEALLAADPSLATASVTEGATRSNADRFLAGHHIYQGDTALHVAAAAYRSGIARHLIGLGADVAASNRRGARPLHYAADGTPGADTWDPVAQAEVIALLISAGAEPEARDKSGVAALHRAVRKRCAAAVGALLAGGADPGRPNGNGSTPMLLATRATGRGGSGSPEAKAQQAEIIRLLRASGPG